MRWGVVALVALLACLGARPAARAETGHTLTLPAGWNMVSGPEGQVFRDAAGVIYYLRPGDDGYRTQPATAAVHATFGYWAYFPRPATVTLSGDATLPATLTLLPRQQVLIGNPSATQTVRLSGADEVVRYDAASNTWLLVLTLEPGEGAWAFSLRGGPLTFSALTPPAPPARSMAEQPALATPAATPGPATTPTAAPAVPPRSAPPTAPTGLRTVALDRNRIQLDWTDDAGDADGFVLQDGLDQHRIAVVSSTVTTFMLVDLEPATRYCVTVYAFNSVGGSSPSNEACAETPP